MKGMASPCCAVTAGSSGVLELLSPVNSLIKEQCSIRPCKRQHVKVPITE